MIRLKLWQWIVLATPLVGIIIFLLVSAGLQIHEWGINWIWAVFTVVFVGWRWLLGKWTTPITQELENSLAQIQQELESALKESSLKLEGDTASQIDQILQNTLTQAQVDPPIWVSWQQFWNRCLELVDGIAKVYHPEQKYPVLNIYVPQAYALIRGTVDDVDRYMQSLSPALNQVTLAQAYQAYEIYRQWEPSARKLLSVWSLAQWVLNPVAAIAKQASQPYENQANQQLLANLSQALREVALRNLCRQAIALYGNIPLKATEALQQATPKSEQTQTLKDIIALAEPVETVEQQPVNIILGGRTGAGKSSLINTLFTSDLAKVDVLPTTDLVENYQWDSPTGEMLTLWDTPGYEQVNRPEYQDMVLRLAKTSDILLLVTPALDPSLQMDLDFIKEIKESVDITTIVAVTQVDRLRPLKEWEPPYNWLTGDRPKEKAIREATQYRAEILGNFCSAILPIVTADIKTGRAAWGVETLSLALMENLEPSKKLRLARFFKNLEARSVGAAKIIDRYTLTMTTTRGLTTLVKSPVLQFISTISTGSPKLAFLLAEKIPVEQLPIVIGKLQMAYDLHGLLTPESDFDLLSLWPLLIENPTPVDRNVSAFGHTLVEFWTSKLTTEQLKDRFNFYLQKAQV